ncbi:MAG: DUF1926 domain-containing protein [Betaproteobacteria bacterium]|nr:DUF1926 domain-containing protein [Betaproteobacteria bacterium]
MTPPVSLLFGVHAHQPVGNFDQVLVEAHERCYRPFLQTMYRFPEFRFAVHFSGWLLDWLLGRYPADLALLREMVARGQVELFGGGDTEPVLAVIPTRDRVGQVTRLSDRLERSLGQRPRGAWLTERVWEATVVPSLADSGIRYVTVDDYHFLCLGKQAPELTGYFSTEEDGHRLDLFPISEALRYRIPFSRAEDAVTYLESLARGADAAAIYFDDIEKFGIWPETYEWVYEKGWLEQFVRGVLASAKIRTRTYADYHASAATRGIIYLPATSYIEMNEWTLPACAARDYADLVKVARDSGRYDKDKAFLRGGIWKNFLFRYPEANWMHKRMLRLSERVNALPAPARRGETLDLLYRAQANDAYWHGLFGGIYLPHLRRAVYHAIVALESRLDAIAPRAATVVEDLDLDGIEDAFLHNGQLQAVVRLDGGASLMELDAYELGHNFVDTLRRQPEHYHRKIELGESIEHSGDGIASAHDRIAFKHEIATEDLATDARGRTAFADRWIAAGSEAVDIASYRPQAPSTEHPAIAFRGGTGGLEVAKRIAVAGQRLLVEYRLQVSGPGNFETELNLALPSCDGPAGRYVVAGRIPGGFGQPLALDALPEIVLEDGVLGGSLTVKMMPPAHLDAGPFFTVSQSEAGFEKIMQAVTLRLAWPVETGVTELSVVLEISH